MILVRVKDYLEPLESIIEIVSQKKLIWQKVICFVDFNLIETSLEIVRKNSMLDLAGF